MKRVVLCVAAMGVLLGAQAQSLKDAKKTFESGSWSVLRNVDMMTDKVSCTGIYKKDFGTQLGTTGFYFRVQGGIKAVTLRFDDEPPRPLRLASDLEKELRSVILEGADRNSVLQAKRLRYQVLTLISGVQQGDIDLTGLQEAAAHMDAGCPEPK